MPRKWDDFHNRNATWIAPFAHGTERGGLEMNDFGAGGEAICPFWCYRQPTTKSHWSCWLSDRNLDFVFFFCRTYFLVVSTPILRVVLKHKHMMSLGGAFSKLLLSAWKFAEDETKLTSVCIFSSWTETTRPKWPRCFQGCQVCLRNLDFLGRGFCEHLGMIKSTRWAPTSCI